MFGRIGALSLALAAMLAFSIDAADARVGRGGSFGSRGTRTYTPPPTTQTTPRAAQPMQKSMTQPNAAQPGAATRPGATSPMASRFGSGFGGLLLGGLLGAGLFGLLSGAGLFGGLSGFASLLGLMLQMALIAGVAYLVIGYFRNRQQPAHAYGPGRAADAGAAPGAGHAQRSALNGMLGGGAASTAAGASDLAIGPADYDAFERLLGEIQGAHSREDVHALVDLTTPEMLTYFSQDLHDNKANGVRNDVSDVKLLQGDLAEAWTEAGSDYATVAMRFALRDTMVDRATGKLVSGDPGELQEATETWTFRRDHGQTASLDWKQGWQLSAIQQMA